MADAIWASRPGTPAVELGGETPSSLAHSRKMNPLRCSFCQTELGEKSEPIARKSGKDGQRMSASRFCSTRCRDCVLALQALNPSPLASDTFISRRALLTDRLLELWRHGQGPDPALVLRAAGAASSGFATPTAV